jgi:predicted Zn-ribbon and HTH transcriptional regulator
MNEERIAAIRLRKELGYFLLICSACGSKYTSDRKKVGEECPRCKLGTFREIDEFIEDEFL